MKDCVISKVEIVKFFNGKKVFSIQAKSICPWLWKIQHVFVEEMILRIQNNFHVKMIRFQL